MAGGYQAQPPDGIAALAAQLKKLQADFDAYRNAAPNRNGSISDGGDLILLDSNDNQVVKLGHDSANQRGMALTTPAGVDMLDFAVTSSGFTALILNDLTGNAVLQVDSLGDGTGLRWPWIPITFGGMTIAQWPFNTSGTFTTVAQAGSNKTSQKIYVDCRAICDGGATAGAARLLVNGTQIGSTLTFGTSVSDLSFTATAVADPTIQQYAFIELQTRVTAGAGNARLQPYQAMWLST